MTNPFFVEHVIGSWKTELILRSTDLFATWNVGNMNVQLQMLRLAYFAGARDLQLDPAF